MDEEDDKETDDGEYWRVLEWGWSGSGRHKFTRDLRLRRIDKEITKAVKEKRWKDADELETKFEWTKELPDRHFARMHTEAQSRPAHFAGLPTPGGRPVVYSPHTSDEYVEDPEMIRVIEDRWLQWTGKDRDDPRRPPKRPLSPPNGDGSSNKKGNFGPRHGHAEVEPDPTRYSQLPPGIHPDPCPDTGRCFRCRKCCVAMSSCWRHYDANANGCRYWGYDEVD